MIENILNAAKGAAGAKKSIVKLFFCGFWNRKHDFGLIKPLKNRLRRVAHMSRGTHAF
jgi:hypothetical protein